MSKLGKFLLRRHTMRERMRAKLKVVTAEMQRRRHQPIPEQGRWLASVVRGHTAYFGAPTNVSQVASLRTQVGKSRVR